MLLIGGAGLVLNRLMEIEDAYMTSEIRPSIITRNPMGHKGLEVLYGQEGIHKGFKPRWALIRGVREVWTRWLSLRGYAPLALHDRALCRRLESPVRLLGFLDSPRLLRCLP